MDEEKIEQEPRDPGELVAGLDIGTTKVCAMIGEVFDDRVEVIGIGTAASSGMKKGVVVNIESTVKSIRQAVEAASDRFLSVLPATTSKGLILRASSRSTIRRSERKTSRPSSRQRKLSRYRITSRSSTFCPRNTWSMTIPASRIRWA
jgi:hypothetical protein